MRCQNNLLLKVSLFTFSCSRMPPRRRQGAKPSPEGVVELPNPIWENIASHLSIKDWARASGPAGTLLNCICKRLIFQMGLQRKVNLSTSIIQRPTQDQYFELLPGISKVSIALAPFGMLKHVLLCRCAVGHEETGQCGSTATACKLC